MQGVSLPHAVSALQGALAQLGIERWYVQCECELSELWMPDWNPDGSPKMTGSFGGVTLHARLDNTDYFVTATEGKDIAGNTYAIARFLTEMDRVRRSTPGLWRTAMDIFTAHYEAPEPNWRRVLRIKPGDMPTMAHLREAYRDAKARNVPDADRYYRDALTEMGDDL